MSDNRETWIEGLLRSAQPVTLTEPEKELADVLLQHAFENAQRTATPVGLSLAAAFDLYVGLEYYARVTQAGWLYCPQSESLLFYPFTNVCPRCVLKGEFHFHPANKPASGAIGTITRRLLCVFLMRLFARQGNTLQVYLASEPIDVLICDAQAKIALLAEVKAAPLTTLALATPNASSAGEEARGHVSHLAIHHPSYPSLPLFLFLPSFQDDTWRYELIPLPEGVNLATEGYVALAHVLLTEKQRFPQYFQFWFKAYTAYSKQEREKGIPPDAAYWFTNACGQPIPRPNHWPRRKVGAGYESVSDGKSSVGMDRTDDIKKGIYQVLKIGTRGKTHSSGWQVKTALLSNIHAVRHYSEYLLDLQDIVWTHDPTRKAQTAQDLPPHTEIFNLFDGIITFTQNDAHDEWIRQHFRF